MDFELHPRLSADTVPLGDFELSRVLLSVDARYPWLLLVPRRAGLRELHELDEVEQSQFMRESSAVSRVMVELFKPDKLNVAMLGNVVPQLHVHHVARFQSDPAWPRPIWGAHPPLAYSEHELAQRVTSLGAALKARGMRLTELSSTTP